MEQRVSSEQGENVHVALCDITPAVGAGNSPISAEYQVGCYNKCIIYINNVYIMLLFIEHKRTGCEGEEDVLCGVRGSL